MPSYKLLYFNGRGRAEVARYIFAQAGVEYEDQRVDFEEFMKLKPSLPAGSVPLLYVDGEPLAGSGTINRFLGERFGLAGSNDWENAQLDSFEDVLNDLIQKILPAFSMIDPESKKAEAKEALYKEFIPKYFGILEKRIAANNSADGWMYKNKLTYVDMHLAFLCDGLVEKAEEPKFIDEYPAIKKVWKAVNAQPKIAEWIKNRPETAF